MDFQISYFFIPIISALIGWVTNKIAILLLYHPKNPVILLGVRFQGVFPKRQKDIAKKIGDLVSKHLLSIQDVKNQIFTPNNLNEVRVFIEGELTDYLNLEMREKHPFISLFVGKKQKDKIKTEVLSKLDASMKDLNQNFTYYIEQRIDIRQLVSDKVSNLDSDEVNKMMQKIMSKELSFIEYMGAIIGFLVGIIQIILLILI